MTAIVKTAVPIALLVSWPMIQEHEAVAGFCTLASCYRGPNDIRVVPAIIAELGTQLTTVRANNMPDPAPAPSR